MQENDVIMKILMKCEKNDKFTDILEKNERQRRNSLFLNFTILYFDIKKLKKKFFFMFFIME